MIKLTKNKKIIASFEDLLDNIESSTPLNLKETNAQKNERIAFLLTNFTAFCIYYFDTYFFFCLIITVFFFILIVASFFNL